MTAFAFFGAPLAVTSFVPRQHCRCSRVVSISRTSTRTVRAALDPSFVNHVSSHLDLSAASHLLAAAASVAANTASVANDVAGAAADTVNTAGAAAAQKSGPIQTLALWIESCLSYLHVTLKNAGVPGAYGVAIVLFTGIVKAVLFPLNWKQMESTLKMQSISPKLKAIQNEYKDNPALVNQMTAKLYKDEDINPLLGCFPILLQLPVWIALYRALQNMAKEDILNEPFLWVPSLQGPVSQTGQSLSTWLFPLVDGAPPIGWHDALSYLILPALIVFSQIITARVMTPQTDDPTQKQANTLNKVLPVIIGWFVLNVPSALGLYMFTNNILSTAQTMFVRSRLGTASASGGGSGSITVSKDTEPPAAMAPPDGFKTNSTPSATTVKAPKSSKAGKSGRKRRKRR